MKENSNVNELKYQTLKENDLLVLLSPPSRVLSSQVVFEISDSRLEEELLRFNAIYV